jgi:hypothetical protein
MSVALTIRLTDADNDNLQAIANAMRSPRNPFPTRSGVLRFALAMVASDPDWFIGRALRGTFKLAEAAPESAREAA